MATVRMVRSVVLAGFLNWQLVLGPYVGTTAFRGVLAILSSKELESTTEGYCVYPIELQADLRLVPWFIVQKLEHLIPK